MLRHLVLLLTLVSCSLAQFDANCNGKQVMVQLFEWKWKDIALECERYLSANQFCGIQVSPPNEHILRSFNPPNPWWIRYQPVSYKLVSRSGSQAEFTDMVQRCNRVGVRIYVDAVINHMTGLSQTGSGSAGSSFDSNTRESLSYPGVPYNTSHFTPRSMCPSANGNVDNFYDYDNIRNCYYGGLTDLYTASEYVQSTIAAYLQSLINIGVAGIRVDAAKQIWPADIANILRRLTDLPTSQGFAAGSKLFVYQTVYSQNEGIVKVDEYYNTGLVTEYRYVSKIAAGIDNYFLLSNLVDFSFGMASAERAFVFVDDHDMQRTNDTALTFKKPRDYKQAVAYTLAQEYGFTRIMSSYDYTNEDQGPPSNDADGYTPADVTLNPDGTCQNGWVCEHRWNVMKKMVKFRNAVAGTPQLNYWTAVNGDAVAFSRGQKGFFAMSKSGSFDQTLQTSLPSGIYCNMIDDCQSSIAVTADGRARVVIANYDEPIMAVCVGC